MRELSVVFLLLVCLSGTAIGQKMPRFSWRTLPVAYHGSNTTAPKGMYNPESIKILAKFATVTLEKYQGINGFPTRWDECQNGTDVSKCGCCVEDNIVDVAKAIKKIDPTTMVMGYLHSNKEYPIYRSGQLLAKNKDWWCIKGNGTIPGYPHQVQWCHSYTHASWKWAEACLAMTDTGYVDGCFMDGCTKDECKNGNPTYMINKRETMMKLQAMTPGPLICGSNGAIVQGVLGSQIQNWGKGKNWATREIPMIMRAVDAGIMFQAHGPCPEVADDPVTINNIAAFLIGAGPYSYYMCGSWTNPPLDWWPIYNFPLGAPLSNATLGDDGVWRRSFKSGTNATFDTNTETGKIEWAKTE